MFVLIKNMSIDSKQSGVVARTFETVDEAREYMEKYMKSKPYSMMEFTLAYVEPIETYETKILKKVKYEENPYAIYKSILDHVAGYNIEGVKYESQARQTKKENIKDE